MKQKIKLILGQQVDAPLANSVPVLLALAALLIAGSGLLWRNAGDTLFLSRESAQACEVIVAGCVITGQDSYVPRMEITAGDGAVYTLMRSQVGDVFDALNAEIQPGDALTLRLSRRGRVLEVEKDGRALLEFGASVRSAVLDVVISAGTAVIFDLLAAFLILRCAALKFMSRQGRFRAGPAK